MTDAQLATFMAESAGGDPGKYGKSAYMLVYERKSKKDLKDFSLDEEEPEKHEVVDYWNVAKFVPDWIKDIVQKDNKKF